MPKVVTIPVRFVESVSDTNRRSSAAVTIQRVLRGFVARRSFGIVRRIDREVDGIESTIARDLDLILVEEKERLRTNEVLMALLLRLDSVRGARDYRRKVIRRVISLQEFVDSMMAGAIEKGSMENQETLETEEDQETLETVHYRETVDFSETLRNQGGAIEETLKTTKHRENSDVLDQGRYIREGSIKNEETLEFSASEAEGDQETLEIADDREIPYSTVMEDEGTLEIFDYREIPYFTAEETTGDQETLEISGSKTEEDRETLGNQQEMVKETIENQEETIEETKETVTYRESLEEALETTVVPIAEGKQETLVQEIDLEEEEVEWSIVESSEEERKSEELGLRGTVERLELEKETLKRLVAELCQRSALQCSMMEGLAERVQQLEKTVQAMKGGNVALAAENK